MRYELTGYEWDVIRPMLPIKPRRMAFKSRVVRATA